MDPVSNEIQPVITGTPPTQEHPSDKKKYIITIGIIILFLLAGGFYYFTTFLKQSTPKNASSTISRPIDKPITVPTNTIDENYRKIVGTAKIAYVQNKQLHILDQSGDKKLEGYSNIQTFKISPDGKYIGWIEYKKSVIPTQGLNPQESIEPNELVDVPSSVLLWNLQDDSVKEVVKSNLSNEEYRKRGNLYNKDLLDFDFYPNDSTKIVYIRDGVWVKDMQSGKEERILKNNDDFMNGYIYRFVTSNPITNYLLLTRTVWENEDTILYNLMTKKETKLDIFCMENHWSNDGKQIISSGAVGYCEGGLWITSLDTLKIQKVINNKDNPSPVYSLYSVSLLPTNQIAASMSRQTETNEQADYGLYIVDLNGAKKIISTKQYVYDLQWLADKNRITYLVTHYKDQNKTIDNADISLYAINPDGTDEEEILKNITFYKWLP